MGFHPPGDDAGRSAGLERLVKEKNRFIKGRLGRAFGLGAALYG
jgi:hypothetical protein